MAGMCCNIVLFCFLKSQAERLQVGNTNIKNFFQQFTSEIFRRLSEPPTYVSFCNKQCILQKARVELTNEILTTSGK